MTVGQTATFSVVASGSAPFSYVWKKNSVAIANATGSSYITPTTTTADNGATFTVTVTNSVGSITSNTATLTVTADTGLKAKMGTNINWCVDWDPEKLPADLMWSARPWALGDGNADSSAWAPTDAHGWPIVSIGTVFGTIFEAAPWPGIYKLSFKNRQGTTGDTVSSYSGDITVTNRQHDYTTNITTYDINVQSYSSSQYLWLRWAGSTGGVTNVRLMRPLKDRSGWHAIGTPLSDHIVDRLAHFTTIRTMQTGGGASGKTTGLDTVWSGRTKPWSSQQASSEVGRVGGVAIENLIAMANQVNKDLWIHIPFLVDDDYIRKMAQVLRYGSDGVNPYISEQTSPVFAPLKPNLNLYVEFGNEIWNGGAGYWENENENLVAKTWQPNTNYNFSWSRIPVPSHVKVGTGSAAAIYRVRSAAGATSGGSSGTSGTVAPSGTTTFTDNNIVWEYVGTLADRPNNEGAANLDYDGGNPHIAVLGWRRTGWLAVRHSLIFREVFGDAAMMTRVRPILATQHARYATTDEPLKYIRAVWTAHPVSYYIYALATAPYTTNATHVTSPDTMLNDLIAGLNETTAGSIVPAMRWNYQTANSFGVKYVAYEGGDNLIPELMPGGATTTTITNATNASFDPVLGARMGANLDVNTGLPLGDQSNYIYGRLFKEWAAANGGLFMHFTLGENAGAGSMFGLCPPSSQSKSDCRLETGPKWDAVKAYSQLWGL